jgi:hypothetical protein
MDNYQVAINGTSLAARILGIETPDVQFFYNQDLTKKGINSIFLKDKYIIAFNEEWIEQANPMEIQVTCFHESRHAFQWEVINSEYTGTEIVDSVTIQKWKDEMSNYNSPTKKDIPEEEYLKQETLGSVLADIAIYLLGLSEMLGINLSDEIQKKILVNENREYAKVNGANVKK